MSIAETQGHVDVEVHTVAELHERFRKGGVRRAAVVMQDGEYRLYVDPAAPAAEPLLPALLPYLPPPADWQHQAIFIGRPSAANTDIDTLFFAFIHNTQRGLAQGGLRLRDYTEEGELRKLFEDGLRLAQGMTLKNAMAKLWWGGGKGIIAASSDLTHLIERNGNGGCLSGPQAEDDGFPARRAALFEEYGRFVSELGGAYYTAADMNTDGSDMLRVLRATRFVTCLPQVAGGSADPSPVTAEGVFRAIKASWGLLSGAGSLQRVRVAVQGVGKVGAPLAMDLLAEGAHVWVGDVKQEALDSFLQKVQAARDAGRRVDLGELTVVPVADGPQAILRQEVDVIAPCAAGQIIDQESIAGFTPCVKLVCGAANNMLGEEDRDAALLHAAGICYVPDFVCNRMGIMNCADEGMGFLEADSKDEVERVVEDVVEIVRAWRDRRAPTLETARKMAMERLAEPHPLTRMHGRAGKLINRRLARMQPGR
jgi:glutamate dehydrogenase/leucine dehydrogenase